MARVPSLWKVEALFWLHYTFRFTPLDIYLQTRGSRRPFDDFRYGETPWFTGRTILETAGLTGQDVFCDLGCGRGKMVFLAHLMTGCRAFGVDLLGGYLAIAQRIRRLLGLEEVDFFPQDFAETDLSEATVVYVAGTIFSQEARDDLMALVDELPVGARWITVGWQAHHPALSLQATEEHLFSWGRERVFFHLREGREEETDDGGLQRPTPQEQAAEG